MLLLLAIINAYAYCLLFATIWRFDAALHFSIVFHAFCHYVFSYCDAWSAAELAAAFFCAIIIHVAYMMPYH